MRALLPTGRSRIAIAAGAALLLLGPRPATAARGGPDAGGWSWADSFEPGITLDVETPMAPTTFATSWPDNGVFPVNLSFPVTLYGTSSSTVWVSSNGWVSLVDPAGNSHPTPAPIPSAAPPGALIAYYWTDLAGGGRGSGVESPTANGHQLTLGHTLKGTGEYVEVVIQFYRNGSIKLVYNFGPTSRLVTIGIEDATGGAGTELLGAGRPAPGFGVRADYAVLLHPTSAPGCAAAPAWTCGATVAGTTAGSPSRATRYALSTGQWDGGEAVYALDLATPQALNLQLNGIGGRSQALFLLGAGCDGATDCLAGGTTTLALPLLAAGRYYVVVDGQTPADNGNFNLSGTCTPALQTIACGQTVAGAAAGASRIDRYACSPPAFPGGEAIYRLDLATPSTVTATLSSVGAYDLVLAPLASLGPPVAPCLRVGTGQVGALNLPAGSYAIVADSQAGATEPFSLRVDCQAQVTALPIACGDSNVLGDNRGPSLVDEYGCGTIAYPLGEAYYRFRPASRVIATATVSDGFNYDVFGFREADAPDPCLGRGGTALTLVNARPDDYLFALDSDFAAGPVGLSLTCQAMSPVALTCGGRGQGQIGSQSFVANYDCLPTVSYPGGEAYFVFDNPVTQPLAFAVTGAPPGVDVDLAVFDGAFSANRAACLAGGRSVVRIDAAPPGEYLVVVDSSAAPAGTPVEVSAVCGFEPVACAGAPELSCNSKVSGDTSLGVAQTTLYRNVDGVFSGPETVFHFTNPVRQSVDFLLRNPSDPGLDLILLRGCDGSAVVDWGDDSLVEPQLDPGDYYLVVDGRDGARGSFELVTMCGRATLDPPVLDTTVEAGTCYHETKKLYFPTLVPTGDVMFSFDLSGSMEEELEQVKRDASTIYNQLNQLVPSLEFGLASLVEYNQRYTDTVCGVNHFPTADNPYHFKVHQPLSPDINLVSSVLQGISLIGGAKETYTRSFYEAYTNPEIGWRACSRRLWINFGDEVPVDCNTYACSGGNRNTGRDPGPDLITGTADDLELLPTVDAMAANDITLIHVDSSENLPQIAMWDCLARRTGGVAFVTDRLGRIPGHTDIARALVVVIEDTLRPCPEVRLEPTGPYASWVTITPPSFNNVLTPFYGEFEIDFCVPPGTPPGVYAVPVEARCLGASSCAIDVLGVQGVSLTVTPPCPLGPSASAAPVAGPACAGDRIHLDGSASTACNASGLEYRWLEGATEVCPWSPSPTCDVVATGTTVYALEVRCLGTANECRDVAFVPLQVEPNPAAALLPLPIVCASAPVMLDASATDPLGCSTPLEFQFREGATVLQPWSLSPTHGPLLASAGATYWVDARCGSNPGCAASASQDLTVVPLPRAVAGPDGLLCPGDSLRLDASGSEAGLCPGGPLYEWREGATVVRPASPDPTYLPDTSTAGTRAYRVVVSCAGLAGCEASDDVLVTVVEPPLAAAGPDQNVCFNDPVTLDAGASQAGQCPGGAEYEWRRGATVVRPWSPDPTWSPPTGALGGTVYTVAVRCTALPGCPSSDDLLLTIRICQMAVQFERVGAERLANGTVRVSWRTLLEDGTSGFVVLRATAETGPWSQLGFVAAEGPGFDYTLVDNGLAAGVFPWYQVVELTADGRGDESPVFRPPLPDTARGTPATPAAGGRQRDGGGERKR